MGDPLYMPFNIFFNFIFKLEKGYYYSVVVISAVQHVNQP